MIDEELRIALDCQPAHTDTLNLLNSDLNDDNMHAILCWLNSHPEITGINLAFNDIGWKGMIVLLSARKVERLDLAFNRVRFEGEADMVDIHVLQNTNVRWLNLGQNFLTEKGKKALNISRIEKVYMDYQFPLKEINLDIRGRQSGEQL